MHAYLVHADIMVSVIKIPKGFNANAMEVMMDRPALVRIVQFQLELSALSREIRVYARAVFVSVNVSSAFEINKRARMQACIFFTTLTHLLSVIVACVTILSLAYLKITNENAYMENISYQLKYLQDKHCVYTFNLQH